MSNVLKVGAKTKVNVQLFENYGGKNFKIPTQEEIIEKKVREAFQDGYLKGKQEGEEETKQYYEAEIKKLQENSKNFVQAIEEKLDNLEKSLSKIVFDLSIGIAEKIIQREVQTRSTVKENVEVALKKLSGATNLTVKVNPEELGVVKEIIEEQKRNTFKHITIEADERIEIGECIVESEMGNVSAQFSAQLEEIIKDFEKYYSGV